jgi:hypothetical protein
MKKILMLLGVIAVSATMYAGDVTGKWAGKMETPNGSREVTMTFKADGAALTGSVSGRNGETPIENGKIEGDTLTFTVTRKFNDREMKTNYKGTISGETINLKYQMRDTEVALTLKRATS